MPSPDRSGPVVERRRDVLPVAQLRPNRELLPGSGLPHLGLRELLARVVALPARVLRADDGRLVLLLPPRHPYARRLARAGPAWQLPLPLTAA